ncbi:DUF4209 domain-containing protein [Pedobacter jeongneungensis]|uniref:DUF4209 domain-containing protein n=1 Tax=Pedobacter jeongneungensis TaxID=947309 RepID=UPI00046A9039|nr:DUF4209 domain-containing protein [Pedobacter jeongneungensis]
MEFLKASDRGYLKIIYSAMLKPEYAYFELIKHNLPESASSAECFQTEVRCFGFMLKDGSLAPIMEFGTHKTTDIKRLTSREIDYLKIRIVEEQNAYLSARYAHILYLVGKNNLYGKKAADAYLQLAQEYLSGLDSEDRHINGLMELLEAYLTLCRDTKYNIHSCKELVAGWLDAPGHHLYYYQRLLELTANSRIFNRTDIIGYTEKAVSFFQRYYQSSHSETYLSVCLLIAKKEGVDLKPIFRMMGNEQINLIAESIHDTSGFIKADRLANASKFYKKAGDSARADELLRELHIQKRDLHFDVISSRMDINQIAVIIESTQNIAAYHLAQDIRTIFFPIALDRKFVPKAEHPFAGENAFLQFVTTSYYDINLNSHRLSPFELRRRDLFQGFQIALESSLPIYFRELIKKMEKQERDFLAEGLHYFEHTWFASQIQNGYADNPQIYSWIAMLRPSLEILIQANITARNAHLDYQQQMAFDQLAVKFEGLLRDLCSCANLTTTKVYDDRTVAKDINELLQSDELNTTFLEEDLRLWQFTFTGSGYNIRNNVAHAFYRPKDYTITLSNILLLAYIKLAKYGNLMKVPENKEHAD